MSNFGRKLFKDTAIYGIGSMITSAGSLLLMPLYARYLKPVDYGILATAAVLSMSLEILLSVRLESAFTRFYFDENTDPARENRLISTLFFSVLAIALCVSSLFFVGQKVTGIRGINGISFYPYLQLAILAAFFFSLGAIPMALLRVQQKAVRYVSINICQFVVNAGSTIYLVIFAHQGAAGSLRGTLIASIVYALICLAVVARHLRADFDRKLMMNAVNFSLPLLPNAVSLWALQQSDRLILGIFVTLASIGIYSFGYNLGMGMAVIISAFTASWPPLFFDAMKKGEETGARVMGETTTYVLKFLILIALTICMVSREMILVLAPPAYRAAMFVIPWVVLAYLCQGAWVCFYNVMAYFKKTKSLPLFTGAAALVNIALNFLLVPRYGFIAAAWTTTIAYLISAALIWNVSRKYLVLAINWRHLVTLSILSLAVYFLARQLEVPGILLSLLYKAVLMLLFVTGLFQFGLLPSRLLIKVPVVGKFFARAT